jgi:hypothetical protein
MGRPRKWDSDAERMAAKRAGSGPARRPGPNDEVILAAREQRPLTEEEEQAIRDRWGYTESEKRTKAERDATARRMLGKSPQVEIPADIGAVWGGGRLDGNGHPAIETARFLINEWGLDRFRNSALHRAALDVREITPDPR